MTRQKSFKGRVRARMDKTSERYSTARRQLLAKAGAEPEATPEPAPLEPAPLEPAPPQEAAAPGASPRGAAAPPVGAPGARRPYSDEVVRANTGRTWDDWFALLDAWGAAERPHPEIARWVAGEHGVGGWWAQGVTVAYEQARGLRAPGQRRGGLFEVNASKTVAVPVDPPVPGLRRPRPARALAPGRHRRGPHRAGRQVDPGQLGRRLDPPGRRLHRPRRVQEPGRPGPRARPRRRDRRPAQALLARTDGRTQAGPGGLTGACAGWASAARSNAVAGMAA